MRAENAIYLTATGLRHFHAPPSESSANVVKSILRGLSRQISFVFNETLPNLRCILKLNVDLDPKSYTADKRNKSPGGMIRRILRKYRSS